MSAKTILPPPAAGFAASAGKIARAAEKVTRERHRDDLIRVMTEELAAEKLWLTSTYKAMVAFQYASTQTGYTSDRVCLQVFNPWLREMGFPYGDGYQVPPDADAEVTADGEGTNLSHLTVKGLRARREMWHASWAKRRAGIRLHIINGVGQAHGNFSVQQRDEALAALGLEPVARKTRVSIYVDRTFTTSMAKVSNTEIRNAVAKALQEITGDGESAHAVQRDIVVTHRITETA